MAAVIIGAGHAGIQVAESLRSEGYAQAITLIDRSEHAPYQRPPLSKDYIAQDVRPSPLPLRGSKFYAQNDIRLMTGTAVSGIDTSRKQVLSDTGESIGYDDLIIATGADARKANCQGAQLQGIHYLRTVDDAEELRNRLGSSNSRVVVVGAGFIGLEFAAVAVSAGLDLTSTTRR